jgi:hypothetical protein
LWLSASADPHQTARLTRDAVGIREREPAFVVGARGDTENAAGKSLRHGVFEMFPLPEDTLTPDADEWEGDTPLDVADPAELDGDGGVAVVVAAKAPLEAKVVERRMLDDELAGLGAVLGCGGPGDVDEKQRNGEDPEESQRHREPPTGRGSLGAAAFGHGTLYVEAARSPPMGALLVGCASC